MTSTTFEKSIRYDRETRDFAMYLDGEMVGYARTYHDAESALDQLAYDLLADGAALSVAQLDGASGPDACAAEARQGKAQAER